MTFEPYDDSFDDSRDRARHRPLGEHEYPDPPDDESDELDTLPCPACGEPVYEELSQCPHCGEYVTADTRALAGMPIAWVLLGVVGILATLWALAIAR